VEPPFAPAAAYGGCESGRLELIHLLKYNGVRPAALIPVPLRGALRAAQPELVKGREALVVDDMYTTGATDSQCARVLRRAGAVKVWVATLARTLKISAQHGETRPGMRLRWA
jgi:hypoxanthine phosphoribosyltransferase